MTNATTTSVETVGPVRRRVQVEVPAATVQREIDRAFESVRRTAHLRGFRPGRAPRHVLDQYYGEQIRREVTARLVEESFQQALEEHALAIVGSPELDVETVAAGAPFRYTALVDIPPTIELARLEDLQAERRVAPVTDEAVEATLRRLRDAAAQLRPVEARGVVEANDVVTADVTSRLEEEKPQAREDVMIEAGGGAFPLALERQLVGRHVGARCEIDVPYPDDYGNQGLAGRTVHFAVTIKAIHEKELPPLDDDFARDHGHAESVAALREKIRGDLEAHARDDAEREMREAVLGALVDRHAFEVPPSLVDRRADAMLARLGVRAPEGAEGREALARLREQLRPQAERDVRADLVLDAIAAANDIAVSDADLDAEVEAMAAHEAQPERVRALYGHEEARRALRTRLVRTRAFDHVLSKVRVADVAAPVEVAPT